MEYKRQYRQLSDETKQNISQNGLKNYWQTVPNRPDVEEN